MDFVFLPYQAVMLFAAIAGGLIGAWRFRKENKKVGFAIGVGIAVLFVALLKAVIPVKMTTNTAEFTTQSDAAVMRRHSQPLPPRVVVERLSYDEALKQKSKALRSRGENQ